jgi:tellurite resistance protein TerC
MRAASRRRAKPSGKVVFNRLFGEYKQARKWIVAIIGGSILCIGALMIILPGPAFIVIPAGLAVLATEFAWARRLLKRIKKKLHVGSG